MSACHASSRAPTRTETAIMAALVYLTVPALAAVVVWLVVSLLGWPLALLTGAGLVTIEYREPLSSLLPVRTEHHRTLGVSRFATRSQIEQSYRRAIQHSHPDRGGADVMAADLNRARAELMGRKRHD